MNTNISMVAAGMLSAIGNLSCQGKADSPVKPNIVIILADDMGFGDVRSLNPKSRIPTPHIDALVHGGIAFTDAHASASVCTPSRYGLLTGRYAFRSEGAAYGIGGFDAPVIEPGRETLPSALRRSGYTSACIGKWHLGLGWAVKGDSGAVRFDPVSGRSNVDYTREVTSGPNDFGFDYSFIHPASLDIPPYVFLRDHRVVDPQIVLTTDVYPSRLVNTVYAWDKKHTNDQAIYWEKGVWWRQGEMSASFRVEKCQEEIVREGLAFIGRQAKSESPFFLYLPLTGPHTPWVPSERFRGRSDIGLYGDFVMEIDDVVGQVVQTLKKHGVFGNTILVFASDNGAYWPQEEVELHRHDSNEGRRGQKGDIHEGGHRIPLVVSWPDQVRKPVVYEGLVSLTDMMATLTELAGDPIGVIPGEDSYSFAPVINGDQGFIVREHMVHHSSRGMFAIREGDWKYINGLGSGGFTSPASGEPGSTRVSGQLYDLNIDSLEQVNLFLKYPEKIGKMKSMMVEMKNILHN